MTRELFPINDIPYPITSHHKVVLCTVKLYLRHFSVSNDVLLVLWVSHGTGDGEVPIHTPHADIDD